MLGRRYEIENDLMVGFTEDGTQSQIRLERFIKTYKAKDYVLLYSSQMTIVYLPKYAFASEDEYNEVIKIVEQKIAAGKHSKSAM